MKHIKYIAICTLALASMVSCYDDETNFKDESVRVSLSPAPEVFKANGKTSQGNDSFIATVCVFKGSSLSSLEWEPSVSESWAQASKTIVVSDYTDDGGKPHDFIEDGIEVTVGANSEYRRTFDLVFTVSDGTRKTFTFTQLGLKADASVTSETGSMTFFAAGGTQNLTYITNMGSAYAYSVAYDGDSKDWLTIQDNGVGSLQLTAAQWTDKENPRTATLTITVGSESTSLATLDIPVKQNANIDYFYMYGGAASGLAIGDAVEISHVGVDLYRVSGYFMNTGDGKNPVLFNKNGRTFAYPYYALASDGTVKEIASAGDALPAGPVIDVDGMRTLTINFESMTWEWLRITATNCLPDEEVSKYATVTYTANGRTKTWMRTCLNWNGGDNIGSIKLGSRMVAPANNVGGYTGGPNSYSTVRVPDYDEVESGGKAQGEVEASEKYGRIYTLREFLSGEPTGALDLERLLADWPEPYHPGSTFTDAVGNKITMKNYTSITNVDEPTLTMQIQGICPYGWHAANVQDFYDMLCAAAVKKGVDVPTPDKMIGKNFMVGDMIRGSAGWNDAPVRHALADEFGFDLYPQGRREFSNGFTNYGVYGEMFIICPGGIGSQKAYQSWRIQTLRAAPIEVQISTSYNIGDCAASFRCVKNYK